MEKNDPSNRIHHKSNVDLNDIQEKPYPIFFQAKLLI